MRIGVASVLAAALLAAGCSKKNEPTAPSSTSTGPAPAAPAPAPVADPVVPAGNPLSEEAPAAGLSLSANGSTKPTLFKGWPLTILASSDSAVAPPALEVRDPSGAAVSLPFSGPTGKGRRWTWTLAGDQTSGLATGAWSFRASGTEIVVVVDDPPPTPTESQRRSLFLGRAGALLAAGKSDEAAALAREEQARVPKDPNPWTLEGDALRQAGKPRDAAARYREALRRHREANPAVKEAPVFLLRRLAEVEPIPFEK